MPHTVHQGLTATHPIASHPILPIPRAYLTSRPSEARRSPPALPLHPIILFNRIRSTGILTDFAWMQSGHFGILNSEFSETACMPGFDRGVTGRSGH
eukprot:COSAG02_NODE_4432_length_5363_cov_9.899506_3_plen_97_part_00